MNLTIHDIQNKKGKEKIVMLTAYDFPMATLLEQAGVDILLVGDSMGSVVYGKQDTLSVTVEDILRHTQAVSRAAQRAMVVADMPFGSYQPSIEIATRNATRFLAEGGAHAVKLEGGNRMADTIEHLVGIGVPVMAHVGLTPQSVYQLGGYAMQGKSEKDAERLLQDAKAVTNAGAFAIVLECVEPQLASRITDAVSVPTIGIGSGANVDGQVLVSNDLLGLTVGHVPKFVKPVASLRSVIAESVQKYVREVKEVK